MSDPSQSSAQPPSDLNAPPPDGAEAQPDPASIQPVHLSGGPDVADLVAANPDLVHRSAAHHAAITTAPEARTPEEQAMADQLGNAVEAIPEADRTPHQHHLLSLWHRKPAEPAPTTEATATTGTEPQAETGTWPPAEGPQPATEA